MSRAFSLDRDLTGNSAGGFFSGERLWLPWAFPGKIEHATSSCLFGLIRKCARHGERMLAAFLIPCNQNPGKGL